MACVRHAINPQMNHWFILMETHTGIILNDDDIKLLNTHLNLLFFHFCFSFFLILLYIFFLFVAKPLSFDCCCCYPIDFFLMIDCFLLDWPLSKLNVQFFSFDSSPIDQTFNQCNSALNELFFLFKYVFDLGFVIRFIYLYFLIEVWEGMFQFLSNKVGNIFAKLICFNVSYYTDNNNKKKSTQ